MWPTGGTCSPTGTTGTWNAASGNSAGWQQWDVDLTAFAGKTVEVSIAYVIEPVRVVLHDYADARAALLDAAR